MTIYRTEDLILNIREQIRNGANILKIESNNVDLFIAWALPMINWYDNEKTNENALRVSLENGTLEYMDRKVRIVR